MKLYEIRSSELIKLIYKAKNNSFVHVADSRWSPMQKLCLGHKKKVLGASFSDRVLKIFPDHLPTF